MQLTGTRRFAAVFGVAIAAVIASSWMAPAMAADASTTEALANFYRRETVRIMVGFGPGGGYDLYGRTLARYIGNHIPGNPTVIAQNMPGAGSIKVANYIYNVAPKDGTVMAIFARGLPAERLLGRSQGHAFEAPKFTWVGSVTNETSVCVFWHSSGIRTWQDMQTTPFTVGGTGEITDLDIFANVLRNMFDLPARLITGFPGGADVVLSMQREEVDGRCAWSWSSLMANGRSFIDNEEMHVTLQLALDPNPELAGVPLVLDLTDDPTEKAALRLIFSRQTMARPFVAPPGLAPERKQALRDAFDATMKDPEFLTEMKRLGLEVNPVSGAEIENLINELYSYPDEVVRMASEAIKGVRQ